MRMLSYDAPMFPKTAENSEHNSGRAAVLLFAEQVNVVVYAGNNPVTDALGAVFIRVISILTYAS